MGAARRTVAGVKADDEARLLLDFLRHRDGRDVVDCRWVQCSGFREGNFGSAVRWCQDGASCKQARALPDVLLNGSHEHQRSQSQSALIQEH